MTREYIGGLGTGRIETGEAQYVGSSGAVVIETSDAGGAGGSAPGATLTATSALTGGAASGGGSSASAPGAALTGTATLVAGVATGGTSGMGTLTTRPQKNNAGTVMADESGAEVFIWDATTGELVLRKTGVTLSSIGVATVTDAAIIPAVSYVYDVKLTGDRRRCNPKAAT